MDIKGILNELTIEEKVRLTLGLDAWRTVNIDRLDINSIRMCDGPHGLRKQYEMDENNIGLTNSIPATCFPPASLTSCSFNRELIYEMGRAIGKEAILQDIDVILGPAINIKRSPLCGRNFEYVSEDPYLASEYAVEFINGVQSMGVGASLKHFAVNNQETLRMNIDAIVDERTLREIYLYAFEKAVKKAKPYTIMASYNKINGKYSCENNHILKDILRREWGYKGLVVSDWCGINDKVKSIKNGCDLEMPYSGSVRVEEVVNAVKDGVLSESDLDEAVKNILVLVDKCNKNKNEVLNDNSVYKQNNSLAEKIAADSMVLLKNDDNILPLDKSKRYAIVGEFAETPRYQGGGSSHITPTRITSMLDVCKMEELRFTYSKGYDVNSDKANYILIKEAVEKVRQADTAIVFIGLTDVYEYEGVDRKNLNLPQSHLKLLEEVKKVTENIVVVLCSGSAVNMEWDNKAKGILYASVMGQAGGKAIYNILFGYMNPSGKLSETFPLRLEDTPSYENFPGGNNAVYYMEGVYVGYRYYNSFRIPVKYPFGFGMSYTSFKYSDMELDKNVIKAGGSINIKVKVKNTGNTYGGEVVQIYIKNMIKYKIQPEIILKNFKKIYLNPLEEKEVSFKINYEDFTYYDIKYGWIAENGVYQVIAASSSIDLRESREVQVIGEESNIDINSMNNILNKNSFCDIYKFKNIYGKELPPLNIKYKDITLNTPLKYCTRTLIGKILYEIAKRKIEKSHKDEEQIASKRAMLESLKDLPIRFLVTMEGEKINLMTGEGLIKMMNGHFFSGLKLVIKSMK